MEVRFRPILTGLLSRVPRLYVWLSAGVREVHSALYSYEVWMKHVLPLRHHTNNGMPRVVAELGPGDTLGVGLAALLSGAEELYALDVRHYAGLERNLELLDEIAALLRRAEPVPTDGWPRLEPYLDGKAFPPWYWAHGDPETLLAPARLAAIREALRGAYADGDGACDGIRIGRIVPWDGVGALRPRTVDFLFSQSVLEHVPDLQATYRAMWHWLRPGGVMSHSIDFRCHNLAASWNGHWSLSRRLWSVIRGRRDFLINRQPASVHEHLRDMCGFADVYTDAFTKAEGISRAQLAPEWRHLSDDDLRCAYMFFQAAKPADARGAASPPAP